MTIDFEGPAPAELQQGDPRVEALASAFHNAYVESLANKETGEIPAANRYIDKPGKPDKDGNPEGLPTIDIAHTPFAELPEFWRAENLGAAQDLLSVIDQDPSALTADLGDPAVQSKWGNLIHDAWKIRREKTGVPIPEDQKGTWDTLDDWTQGADISHLIIAQKLLTQAKPDQQ